MKTSLSKIRIHRILSVLIICILISIPFSQYAIPTTASDIEHVPGTDQFRIICNEGGTDSPCSEIDLSPYQFFWKFGHCHYSFEEEPTYVFKEGEPQDVSVSLNRINIYDEEYGPSKIGFSKTFSGLNVELPPSPITNGLLDLAIQSTGMVKGLFQTVLVIEYENRTQFRLNNAEIVVDISQVLTKNAIVQTCCSGVTFSRIKSAGSDQFSFLINSIEVNEKCNLYLIYNVGTQFKDKVDEVIDLRATSYINFSPDVNSDGRNIRGRSAVASSRTRSDVEIASLRVGAPFDPNSKTAEPSGCISEGEIITYTISFLNEGTAETNLIQIIDTLSDHFDLATFQFASLEILGIDQTISDPAIQVKMTGNVVHWEFPAQLPPQPGSEESQGFLRFKISPKQGLPEETRIDNRSSIVFDGNPGMLTNTMVHKVNCKQQLVKKHQGKFFHYMFYMLIMIFLLLIVMLFIQLIILKRT